MKDKLESVYKEFISEQDKEQFLRLLNDTEAWLHEEGDDETKIVYNKKLEELKNHGDPIFKRVKEFEGRSAAFDNLGAVVVRHDRKLSEPNKMETRSKMGKMLKTLANNQLQNKKIQCTTRPQVNHNRLATTLAQNIPCILAPLISTRMLNGIL